MWVILDRDGVINHDSADYIKTVDEWVAIPNSLAAIARLTQRGHLVFVATNQSGVGRGYFSAATLDAMHQKMCDALSVQGGVLSGIYSCPHHPDDGCACRKPKPGMLHQIAQDHAVSFAQSVLIGDSLRDIEAARAVGVQPILVRTGKGQEMLSRHPAALAGVPVYADLAAAVDALLDEGH